MISSYSLRYYSLLLTL